MGTNRPQDLILHIMGAFVCTYSLALQRLTSSTVEHRYPHRPEYFCPHVRRRHHIADKVKILDDIFSRYHVFGTIPQTSTISISQRTALDTTHESSFLENSGHKFNTYLSYFDAELRCNNATNGRYSG